MITKLECLECGKKWECSPLTEHSFKACPNCKGDNIHVYYVKDLRTDQEKEDRENKWRTW